MMDDKDPDATAYGGDRVEKLPLAELASWMNHLCELHRRKVMLAAKLHNADEEGVPKENVVKALKALGYDYDSGSGKWNLL